MIAQLCHLAVARDREFELANGVLVVAVAVVGPAQRVRERGLPRFAEAARDVERARMAGLVGEIVQQDRREVVGHEVVVEPAGNGRLVDLHGPRMLPGPHQRAAQDRNHPGVGRVGLKTAAQGCDMRLVVDLVK